MLDPSQLGQVLWISWPDLVGMSITAIGWLISFRMARERQSRGLFLISIGLLSKLVVGAAWYVVYWIVLGGTFQVFTLLNQGLTLSQIGALLSLEGLIGTIVSLASWSITLFLIIYGAMKLAAASQIPAPPALITS